MAQLFDTSAQGYNTTNQNPLGSQYAQQFMHKERFYIQREVSKLLTRTWPEQFTDLTFLFTQNPKYTLGREHEWAENAYDRYGFTVTAASTAVTYPSVATVNVATTQNIYPSMVVKYGSNMAMVVAINPTASTVDLRPMTNSTLPSIPANSFLPFVGPLEGDGAKTIAYQYRMDPTRRYNLIALLSGMIEYQMLELQELRSKTYLPTFLSEQMKNLQMHLSNSMSNYMWQGVRGEFVLPDGRRATMCGGIDWWITNFGGFQASTPITSFGDAVKAATYGTMYGSRNYTKFLYTTPENAQRLAENYKNQTTSRYMPANGDKTIANLRLTQYEWEGTKVIVVPFLRFADPNSFGPEWSNVAYLVDHSLINPAQLTNWASTGIIDPRGLNNYTLSMNYQYWMNDSFGLELRNPKAHAKITIQ